MKKDLIIKTLKAGIFLGIFFLVFCILGKFFNPVGTIKEWFQSYAIIEFYKEKENSIDVLYVGNSCIYTGISPMEIYEKTGITGYCFSTPRQKMWSSYYYIREAFRTQKPKIVFLEIGEAFSRKTANDELGTRNAIDPLKLSKNKIEMINDSDYGMSNFEKLSCIFPILRYHSRWSSLEESDLRKFINKNEYTYKGYLLENKHKKYSGKVNNKLSKEDELSDEVLEEEIEKMPDETKAKIEKMIEFCKENNAELIFLKMPEPKVRSNKRHEIIEGLAKDNEVKFIDLNYEDSVKIDWQEDTQDGGDHLNIYGAKKVADFLSNYLKQNYNLESHKEDANFQNWNEDLLKYDEQKQMKNIE